MFNFFRNIVSTVRNWIGSGYFVLHDTADSALGGAHPSTVTDQVLDKGLDDKETRGVPGALASDVTGDLFEGDGWSGWGEAGEAE